jgi:hypothetical protein
LWKEAQKIGETPMVNEKMQDAKLDEQGREIIAENVPLILTANIEVDKEK